MNRFDSNSILVVDKDLNFATKIKEALLLNGGQVSIAKNLEDAQKEFKNKDYDVVICSYDANEENFNKLIDWCRLKLEIVPVFVAMVERKEMGRLLLHHHQISQVLEKTLPLENIVAEISILLFDFQKFHQNMLDVSESRGMYFNLLVNKVGQDVRANEIFEDGVLIASNSDIELGSKAILRIVVHDAGKIENFLFSGFIEEKMDGECLFKVYSIYLHSWNKFMNSLNVRQSKINNFLGKVSGL